MGTKGRMINELRDRPIIRHYQMRSLHLIVIEKMANAVRTFEWAPDDVIKTEARLAVLNDAREVMW